jgi:hypothetical protein
MHFINSDDWKFVSADGAAGYFGFGESVEAKASRDASCIGAARS